MLCISGRESVALLEVEELCFWKWKRECCAFGSGRESVVFFEVEERALCFSKWKSCVFRRGRVVASSCILEE